MVNQIVKLSIANVSYAGNSAQLNYNAAAVPGTATAGKTVVLDSNLNYSGINTLSATNLSGLITTAAQPNITSVGTLSNLSISGNLNVTSNNVSNGPGLYLNGSKVMSTSTELNYLSGVSVGSIVNSKALIADNTGSISGFYNIGTNYMLAQTVNIGSNVNPANYPLFIRNDNNGIYGIRLKNNNSGVGLVGTEIDFSGFNTSDSNNYSLAKIRCLNSAGTPSNNSNAGNLIFYTNDGVTPYSNPGYERMRISSIGYVSINQPNPTYRFEILDNTGQMIKLVAGAYNARINLSNVDGSLQLLPSGNYVNVPNLALNGVQFTSTATEINYLAGVTPGTIQTSKAIISDSNKSLTGFTSLTSTNLFTTNLYLSNSIVNVSATQINYLNTSPGSVNASSALVLDSNKSITNLINVLNLGTLRLNNVDITVTATQINYLSVTPGLATAGMALVLNSSSSISNINNMSLTSITLNGVPITSSGTQINYLSGITTPGIAVASMALVLDSSRNISNINTMTATTLYGQLSTAAQPFITSLGVLTGLKTSGWTMINSSVNPSTILEINQGGTSVNKGLRINFDRGSNLNFADIYMDSNSILNISATANFANGIQGTITTAAQPNITSLGNLTGLVVGGTGIQGTITTPAQPNITSLGNLTGLTVGGTGITGTLNTAAQPNITSLGNLTGLTVGGTGITGTLNTAAQPNITSLGTLSSLNVTGTISGTLTTAAQPNITSLGILASILKVNSSVMINSNLNPTCNLEINQQGTTNSAGLKITFDNTVQSGQKSSVLYLDSAGTLNITSKINVIGNIAGTLETSSQPNITSLGTLTSLNVSGNISGTLTTAAQPNITSLGTLNSLTVSGGTITGILATAAQPYITSLGTLTSLTVGTGGTGNIFGIIKTVAQPFITSLGTLTGLDVAGNISGTLTTAAQPNITSLGTLISLNVSGDIYGTIKTVNQQYITQVGTLSGLTVAGSGITGTLNTNSQPNITSLGTLTSLIVNGNTMLNSTSSPNATLEINQKANMTNTGIRLTYDNSVILANQKYSQIYVDSTGQLNISTNLYVNGNITGLLTTPNQSNITGLGQLTSLKITGQVMIGSSLNPNANIEINQANSTNGIRLTYDNSVSIGTQQYVNIYVDSSGILNTSKNIKINGGTGTIEGLISSNSAYQTNIKGVGTLDSLVVSGGITGTLSTVAQPNITSVGTLGSLTVSGVITAGSYNTTGNIYTTTGNIGIGTSSPTTKLNIVQTSSSSCVTLTYTPSSTTYTANIYLDNTGTLNFSAPLNFPNNSNVSNPSLVNPTLTGTITFGTVALTTNTVSNINTIDTSFTNAGTVTLNNFLMVDSSKNLTGFNNIGASTIAGTLTTASQPNITSLGNLNGLTVGGSGITGTLNTATQTNITSVGTLTSLKTSGNVTIGYNTATTSANLEINQAADTLTSGLQLTYNMADVTPKKARLYVDSAGILCSSANINATIATGAQPNITSVGSLGSLTVTGNASVGSLNLGGTLILATSTQINYLSTIATLGTAAASSIVTTDSSKNITGINNLTMIGQLTLNGTLVNSTATELNYNYGLVLGTVSANKTVTADSSRNITNINILTATSLNGTLLTSTQPNITSIGTLASLKTSGNVLINSNGSATALLEINQATLTSDTSGLKLTYDTSAGTPKYAALYVDSAGNLICSSPIQATIKTAAQPNITSVGSLGSLTVTGNASINGTLTLSGTALSATATQLNYLTTISTFGTVVASGIVTSDSSKNIIGINNLSMTGQLTLNSVVLNSTATELNYNAGLTLGTVSASKTVTADASRNITNINTLTAASLSGTLSTASQPNITTVGTLTSFSVASNSIIGSKLTINTSNPATALSPAFLFDINQNGYSAADFAGLRITYNSADGVPKATTLYMNSSGVLNISSGATFAGTIDATLANKDQPGITAVGTLSSLTTSGSVLIGSGANTARILELYQGGTSTNAGLKLSYDVTKNTMLYTDSSTTLNITSAINLGSNNLTTSGTITCGTIVGTLSGGAQTGITSVGSLTSLTMASNGNIALSGTGSVNINGSGSLTVNTGNITTSAGKLGIGMSSPTSQLHITQTGANDCVALTYNSNTSKMYLDNSGNIVFTANISAPNIGVGSNSPVSITSYTAPTTPTLSTGNLLYVGGTPSITWSSAKSNFASVSLDQLTMTNSGTSSTLTNAYTLYIANSPIAGTNLTITNPYSLYVANGNIYFGSTTTSTTSTSGALVIAGGIGIGGALNISGAINISNNTSSSSTSTGALIVTGGAGIGGDLNIGGAINISNNTTSSSASTGALIVSGGAGIGGAVNIAGAIKISNNTSSSSTSTGALVVSGGAGIGGSVLCNSYLQVASKVSNVTELDIINNNNDSTYGQSLLGLQNYTRAWFLRSTCSSCSTGGLADSFSIYNTGTGSAALFINGNNNNIGIGMTPSYKLDVNGAINCTSLYVNGSAIGGSFNGGIITNDFSVNRNDSGVTAIMINNNNGSTGKAVFGMTAYTRNWYWYVTCASDPTFADALYLKNAGNTTYPLYIKGTNSYVGINTTSPGYQLDVNGSIGCTTLSINRSGGSNSNNIPLYIYDYNSYTTNSGNTTYGISGVGSYTSYFSGGTSIWTLGYIVSASGLTVYSDRRKKKNIEELDTEDAINFINTINPVKYNLKTENDNCYKHYGYIAQDFKNYIDLLGFTPEDNFPAESSDDIENTVISVNYSKIVVLLHKAIKTQQQEITDLKAKNNQLQAQIDQIMSLLAKNNIN